MNYMSKRKSHSMSSNTESDNCPFNDLFEEISDELEHMSQTNNLSVIIKKYQDVKKQIETCRDNLTNLKKDFLDNRCESDEMISDIIYDYDYDHLISEINDLSITILGIKNIEMKISKYQELSKKILLCQKYLGSKKMEIFYCDQQKVEPAEPVKPVKPNELDKESLEIDKLVD